VPFRKNNGPGSHNAAEIKWGKKLIRAGKGPQKARCLHGSKTQIRQIQIENQIEELGRKMVAKKISKDREYKVQRIFGCVASLPWSCGLA
jgi:hypothetical protein